MTYREVAKASELWSGELLSVRVDGASVLLLRTDFGIFAYEDRCPHLGVPLSQGKLEGCTLTCSAHHYEYDAQTGQGQNPKNVCLTSFPVRVEGDAICVDVSPPKDVGPVLVANELGRAVALALVELNPGAYVVDRGAYLRIVAKGRCELRRALIEEKTGAPFRIPSDLESVMPAFEGYLRIDSNSAFWSDRQ
jgi:toluene monooxygenase system ferredoxin subunit